MKKRYTVFTIVILLSGIFFQAKAQVEISGQIKDNNTKESISFCNISVYNQQDSLIAGGISNDNGFFQVPLNPGPHSLVISYVGYLSDTLNVNVGSENQFLGIIKLQVSEAELGEVIVKGSTRGYTIDKDVQMVTSKLRAGSSNTTDVLERMNGVSYDRYNRAVKVDGDNRVILLVNGLEKDQEYIKNLSPDRLKEVEIIRNPGGRYALEGYTAVINIILKSDYRGTEVFANDQVLIDVDTKVDKYIPINNLALTYNYTYDKVNFYLKGNNNYNSVRVSGQSRQDYANGYSIEYLPANGIPNLATNNLATTYTAGIDYYLNPKHTLSFESNATAFPVTRQFSEQAFDVAHYQDDLLTSQYTSIGSNDSRTRDFTNSLFYIYTISSNTKLNAEFTYSRYRDDYINSIVQSNGFERHETGINNKDFTKGYVELNHTLNAKSAITAGYGNTWRRLENNYIAETQLLPDAGFTNDTTDFWMSELRHKLYAYYSLSLSGKLSFKVGAAAEYSHPKTAETDNTYIIYQPYLDFNYAAHKYLDIKLKYRADSEYPSIRQVTPFTQLLDPYTYEKGNPLLRPELIQTVSARFQILEGLVNIEPYYSFSNNRINRIVTPVEGNIFEYSYGNVGNYDSKGIKGDITLPFFKQSLIVKTNFDFFSNSITYNGHTNKINDWTMDGQLLYIGKKYQTVAGLIYQKNVKKLINAQGYDYYNNDFWMVFAQQPFFKKRMTLMLGYILPINFGAIYEQGSYTDAGIYTATSKYDISLLKNMLMFNITYRFSQGKSVRNIEKDIKKETEKKSKGMF
ncbi:MAG: outer membrane beta-barrel protein [Bacteroidota bacterium]